MSLVASRLPSNSLLQGQREDYTGLIPIQTLPTFAVNRSVLKQVEVIGQFDKKCIVACMKTENETQIWLFDQHACHERVNLEIILMKEPNVNIHDANMRACKGAYRFGDELSRKTQLKILEQLSNCNEPFHCAHGRPTCWQLARITRPLNQ